MMFGIDVYITKMLKPPSTSNFWENDGAERIGDLIDDGTKLDDALRWLVAWL